MRKLEAQGARNIGVVRLFVSGESWYDRTRQILGIAPGAPEPPASAAHAHASRHHEHAQAHEHSMAFWRLNTKASFALTAQGLGEAPETAAILAERARALSRTPEREDVLILAHGPGDDAENRRWIAHIDARAEAVRQALPFRRVQVETLPEDWPEKRKEAEARVRAFVTRAAADGGKAIVIPFRIQGFGPYARVLEGLDYVADRTGLLAHPSVTNWIEAQILALRKGPFRSPNDANAVGATGAIAGEVSLAPWRDRGGALLAETRERVLDMDISRAAPSCGDVTIRSSTTRRC